MEEQSCLLMECLKQGSGGSKQSNGGKLWGQGDTLTGQFLSEEATFPDNIARNLHLRELLVSFVVM